MRTSSPESGGGLPTVPPPFRHHHEPGRRVVSLMLTLLTRVLVLAALLPSRSPPHSHSLCFAQQTTTTAEATSDPTCLPDSVTLDISHDGGGGGGGMATLVLYLYDSQLADAAATRVADPVSIVVSEASPVTVVLTPFAENATADLSANGTMVEPLYYVALDADNSDVAYGNDGPVFGLELGGRGQLVVTGGGDGNGGGDVVEGGNEDDVGSSLICSRIDGSITVDIFLFINADGGDGISNNAGGIATLQLYLYDELLADDGDALVATAAPVSVILDGIANAVVPVTVVLTPTRDAIDAEAGMQQPSYYVALLTDSSTVSYGSNGGPSFQLSRGDRTQMVLTGKVDNGQTSVVAGDEVGEADGIGSVVVEEGEATITPTGDPTGDAADDAEEESATGDCTAISDSIVVDVVHDGVGGGGGGRAVIKLWLKDAASEDVTAFQADSVVLESGAGVGGRIGTVLLTPSAQALELSSEMNEPEYYVALDEVNSDFSGSTSFDNGGGPLSSPARLGDRTRLVITGKLESSAAESAVKERGEGDENKTQSALNDTKGVAVEDEDESLSSSTSGGGRGHDSVDRIPVPLATSLLLVLLSCSCFALGCSG